MNAAAEKIESTETGLAIPEITEAQWPEVYGKDDYLKRFFAQVQAEVSVEVPDLKSKKGRDRIASLAAKVSKAKVAVEKPGRDYLRYLKAQPKVVEQNLREHCDRFDTLRDEVRAPLTEWENAEKARVAGHQGRIADIKSLAGEHIYSADSGRLKALLRDSELFDVSTFEEFEGEAAAALVITQKTLRDALAKREAFEAEQAALEKQRQDQEAERQRLGRERIEREAADKARAEAEAKAKADQEAAQRREIEARMAQERAEREAEAAKQREAQAKAEAAAQAERAAQAAVEAEQRRIAAEEAARLAEEKRRQEDQEHRANINRAALADMVALGIDEATAKTVLVGVIQGKVSNVRISY